MDQHKTYIGYKKTRVPILQNKIENLIYHDNWLNNQNQKKKCTNSEEEIPQIQQKQKKKVMLLCKKAPYSKNQIL